MILEMEFRALNMLSKCSVPELHIQSFVSEWEERSRKG